MKSKMHPNAQMSHVLINGSLCPGLAIPQLFVLSVQHSILPSFFFESETGHLSASYIFLLLYRDFKSLCFYNSLGNTPMVLAGTE